MSHRPYITRDQFAFAAFLAVLAALGLFLWLRDPVENSDAPSRLGWPAPGAAHS